MINYQIYDWFLFQVCLKEVTISRDGSSESLPLKRTVRVVRVDEQCSSGTSTDSSSIGSELEVRTPFYFSFQMCIHFLPFF